MGVSNFVLAYKILKDITKDYKDFDAYKIGLIDKKGKKIKNAETEQEKKTMDSYTKIILNMKRLASKMFGQSTLSKAAVTLLLLKENVNQETIDIINKELDLPENDINDKYLESIVESAREF